MDTAILCINHYPVDSAVMVSLILIHWIEIYPMDSTIQLSNNWPLAFKNLFSLKFETGFYFLKSIKNSVQLSKKDKSAFRRRCLVTPTAMYWYADFS